jgi:hydroxymethylglutaryl-CoA lyase
VRNTNKSIADALNTLSEIKSVCEQRDKKLVTYISMGFGNPYGDPYDSAMVAKFVDVLITIGTDVISIADTVGAATAQDIRSIMAPLVRTCKSVEIGVHLHSNPAYALEKINASLECGITRIDGALKGYGGCPMAKDELVGNIATEEIISAARQKSVPLKINDLELQEALRMAQQIFPNH